MSFQSTFLREGNWVTETVTVQDALRHSSAKKTVMLDDTLPSPTCGLLTRTLVESPIVRWVMPVRLRSNSHRDIAFIGSNYVQISELRHDGQIHEVIRKNDFGQRIRSAVVYGDFLTDELDSTYPTMRTDGPDWDGQQDMDSLDTERDPNQLPPQFLILFMESGDCMFLFLKQNSDKTAAFVIFKHEKLRAVPWIGYHLAIDPSCRYLAAASPDGILELFQLRDWTTLNEMYMTDGLFSPIIQSRTRTVQGVIHKMEFLYPRPEDEDHIILVFIVMAKGNRKGQAGFPGSKMVAYEWEADDEIGTVFDREQSGTRLPMEHCMPLLLVPLMFRTAFLVVSADIIGVCKNVLGGSPEFEYLHAGAPVATNLYHGREEPLWTTWTRPFRRRSYFLETDVILVAREDGVILHVEIDGKELIPSFTTAGHLGTNVDTAFTASYDRFSDVIIVGGDSGPGGLWKLTPREELARVSLTPNWSPVVDATSTNDRSFWETDNPGFMKTETPRSSKRQKMPKPDSIFTASGRGLNGTITQWRWGIQARIGLDIESGEPIRQAWVFSVRLNGRTDLYALLGLPHSSLVLHFGADLGQVQAVEEEDTRFDLSSSTLFACQRKDGSIVQITESTINTIKGEQCSKVSLKSAIENSSRNADRAHVLGTQAVVSFNNTSDSDICIFEEEDEGQFTLEERWNVDGEVTAIALFQIANKPFVAIGSSQNEQAMLSIFSTNGDEVISSSLRHRNKHRPTLTETDRDGEPLEPATSLTIVHSDGNSVSLVVGTRCGHLVTCKVSKDLPERIQWQTENMGVSAVTVYPAAYEFNGSRTAFACCDGRTILMSGFGTSPASFKRKYYLVPTDTGDLSMPAPAIHSMHSLSHSLTGYPGHMSLLLLAGSRILLADIWPHVGQVPRTLFLDGTPNRVLYSHTWQCLIVGIIRNGRPTLDFLDPETGEQIGTPRDKDGNTLKSVSGLGHKGDKIMGLGEWIYVKDGRTFAFLLVCTRDGHLMVVSMSEQDGHSASGSKREIKYWTRYRKMLEKPIYSIVGDGNGIAYCVDKTLHWDVLDLVERKLKLVKTFELGSPATSLRIAHGKIMAVTSGQSLQVFNHLNPDSSEMSLVHSDVVSRRALHMMDMGEPNALERNWPITLLSDDTLQVSGMWTPWEDREREFRVLFKGKLLSRIRKFVCARTRPPWAEKGDEGRYGVLKSGIDGGEVVGISLDGSAHHFTLLTLSAWRVLRFLANIVYKNEALYRLTMPTRAHLVASEDGRWIVDPDEYRDTMHVDADMLQLCLSHRNLEDAIVSDDELTMLSSSLDALDDGKWTEEFKDIIDDEERQGRYFALAYEMLEYVFDQVM